MKDRYDDALARGHRAGIILLAALLHGCGAGAQPLRLPEGHPADPDTMGMPRASNLPAPESPATPEPRPPQPEPTPPPPPARTYACPMHPEVVSNEPGRCPKCEMRLQEVQPARNEDAK